MTLGHHYCLSICLIDVMFSMKDGPQDNKQTHLFHQSSVHPSIHPSIHLSVRPSIHGSCSLAASEVTLGEFSIHRQLFV